MGDAQRLGRRNRRCRADNGIFGGIMVHETQLEVMGNDIQLMRFQLRPDVPGDLDAAQIRKIRIGLPVLVERRPHDAEIEGGIMGDHRRTVEVVDELLHHLREFRRVLDIGRANPVYGDVEGRKPHVLRPDETLLDANDLAALYPRKSDGAGAAPLLIGGLEIDGDGFQE
ncbi:hypothetical protein D3C72_1001130 [compost metagenome]